MFSGEVRFFVASHSAWAPGIDTEAAWLAWAHGQPNSSASGEPKLQDMPAMLRRRASSTGKMALETAYHCLPSVPETPIIFASRHGEAARSRTLLQDLITQQPLSPATFSLSVHNANAGLLSIARADRGNHIAIAAGPATVEHAIIEACGLLADGTRQVLLVMADSPPPECFRHYDDCAEQAYAWAWLLQNTPASDGAPAFSLSWSATEHDTNDINLAQKPGGLDILRFYLRSDAALTRVANGQHWQWSRHD
jgi:hypothetical protein